MAIYERYRPGFSINGRLCFINQWRELGQRLSLNMASYFFLTSIRAVFDLLPDLFPLLSPGEWPAAALAGFRRQV